MKRTAGIFLILTVFLLQSVPVLAQSGSPPPSPLGRSPGIIDRYQMLHDLTLEEEVPPGEFVLLDALVLRPVGLAALGVGLAGSIAILPFTMFTNSGSIVGKSLIQEPFDYTFGRPLGDVDLEVNR